MGERTIDDLKQKQALPLPVKISLTMARIRQWVNEFGEDGVYVSFSGGKDSTVLLDIVRNKMGYKDIPAVFVDVPTQYPELKEFAQTYDNLVILKPQISFMKVCEKYGFPIISKEVAECVYGARRYLRKMIEDPENAPYYHAFEKLMGSGDYERSGYKEVAEELIKKKSNTQPLNDSKTSWDGEETDPYILNARAAMLMGVYEVDWGKKKTGAIPKSHDKSAFSQVKYQFLLDAKFEIAPQCCTVMKKTPVHKYAKETGRKPMTAQMADESRLRTQQWLRNGCNGFQMKSPISNPMSFWTENDVLQYIAENNLPICSVYGEVVEDFGEQLDGQMCLADYGYGEKQKQYKTTGCKRTGCMLCGFGCHLEKPGEGRFERLRETHPKMYSLLDVIKNNGVTFREAIEWINEHGNMDIKL